MKKKDKTVGQSYMEAQKSERPETAQDILDTQKPAANAYLEELHVTISKGKLTYPQEHVFFIEVFTRQDRLMHMTEVTSFFPRITCPTPTWNQTVYRYSKRDDVLDYIWTVPSRKMCEYYRYEVAPRSDGERLLISFVHDFEDNTLEKIARRLNEEEYQNGLAFVPEDDKGDLDV